MCGRYERVITRVILTTKYLQSAYRTYSWYLMRKKVKVKDGEGSNSHPSPHRSPLNILYIIYLNSRVNDGRCFRQNSMDTFILEVEQVVRQLYLAGCYPFGTVVIYKTASGKVVGDIRATCTTVTPEYLLTASDTLVDFFDIIQNLIASLFLFCG